MTPQPSLNRWFDRHNGQLQAVLLDIDGVMLNNKHRLPGSRGLIERLERRGLPFLFLTNDGNHSPREKAERMNAAGLAVAQERIISCGHAIDLLVKNMKLDGSLFFAMGDTGTPCYATAAGLTVTRDLGLLTRCAGVIIGEENYDWETVINAVVNFFIEHPDAPLIVPNPDDFYPGSQLKINIGAGGVARFITHILKAYGVEIDPLFLGKPHAPIFEMAETALKQRWHAAFDSRKILMVGDNMAADIAGGRASGYMTALLLTGVTEASALQNFAALPDMVFMGL